MPRLLGTFVFVGMVWPALLLANSTSAVDIAWVGRTGASLRAGTDTVEVVLSTEN